MINKIEFFKELSYTGRVLVYFEKGVATNSRIIEVDEHVSSLNALIDIAKSAGYSIVRPDGNAL
ncbi:hypothetical protein I5L45_01900 [Serratia marcescens]|uniref:hypothetical protein n=1 Tax=Serratia TaxID=613 RepID=UPI0018D834EC|nr:hypothetical protein [Serratia marcescens]